MTIGPPKISVCMAAYNGSRYIRAQMGSILPQLKASDEVIVVDDHSSDGTVALIESFSDSRVRLFRNDYNSGVARTFERALQQATGDIIFLSDQDDLWAPAKVSTVLSAFEKNRDVTLVVTDADVVDEHGVRLGASYYASRGKFSPGFLSNLMRCKYLGCTMAFRAQLLPKVMPFPRGGGILHDIWIGVGNSISSGNALYIDEPLVSYRRHSESLTTRKLGALRRLQTRFHLLRAAMDLWIRHRLAAWN